MWITKNAQEGRWTKGQGIKAGPWRCLSLKFNWSWKKKKKTQENLCACMFLFFTFRVSSINCVPEGSIPKVLLILYNSEKLKHWTSGTNSFSADLSPQEIARVKICSSGFVQFALRQIKYLDSCLSPEGWRHVVIQYCSWLDLLCDW